MDIDEKLEKSKALYRQRLTAIQGKQRKLKLLEAGDKEIMQKGVRNGRIIVETRSDPMEEKMIIDEEPTSSNLAMCTFPKGKRGITLYPADVKRLDGCTYLNDQLINLFTQWAFHRHLSEEMRKLTYICDSHLFSTLTKNINWEDEKKYSNLEGNIGRISGWFKQNELLKNMVFIPICEGAHWFLTVLINDLDAPHTHVLVMDSMNHVVRKHVSPVLIKLLIYMTKEDRTYNQVVMNVQQQENNYDCGVHLIHNATKLMEAPSRLKNPTIADLEEYINNTITTRAELKFIIQQIIQQQKQTEQQIIQQPIIVTHQQNIQKPILKIKQLQKQAEKKQQEQAVLKQLQEQAVSKQLQEQAEKKQQEKAVSKQLQEQAEKRQQERAVPKQVQEQAEKEQQKQAVPKQLQVQAEKEEQKQAVQKQLQEQAVKEQQEQAPTEQQNCIDIPTGQSTQLTTNIIIQNDRKMTVNLTTTTLNTLKNKIEGARGDLANCRQRKRKFLIKIDTQQYRCEISKQTGNCKIKIENK